MASEEKPPISPEKPALEVADPEIDAEQSIKDLISLPERTEKELGRKLTPEELDSLVDATSSAKTSVNNRNFNAAKGDIQESLDIAHKIIKDAKRADGAPEKKNRGERLVEIKQSIAELRERVDAILDKAPDNNDATSFFNAVVKNIDQAEKFAGSGDEQNAAIELDKAEKGYAGLKTLAEADSETSADAAEETTALLEAERPQGQSVTPDMIAQLQNHLGGERSAKIGGAKLAEPKKISAPAPTTESEPTSQADSSAAEEKSVQQPAAPLEVFEPSRDTLRGPYFSIVEKSLADLAASVSKNMSMLEKKIKLESTDKTEKLKHQLHQAGQELIDHINDIESKADDEIRDNMTDEEYDSLALFVQKINQTVENIKAAEESDEPLPAQEESEGQPEQITGEEKEEEGEPPEDEKIQRRAGEFDDDEKRGGVERKGETKEQERKEKRKQRSADTKDVESTDEAELAEPAVKTVGETVPKETTSDDAESQKEILRVEILEELKQLP